MKKWMKNMGLMVFALAMTLSFSLTAQARGEDTIKKGVFAGSIDLSGMTEDEASQAVSGYVESLKDVEITLLAANNQEVKTTVGNLGMVWSNPELVDEALELGTKGNVIERYKMLKDLEHKNKIYPIELDFSIEAINNFLVEKCVVYDQKAVNMSLKREKGSFRAVEGQTGYLLDVEASIDEIYNYLTGEWDHEPAAIALIIEVDEPKGSEEELAQVKDLLGSFTTSYATSNSARSTNVSNGCKLINGTTIYPGDEFSTYDTVSPFTEKNGYFMAGSYLNGKVVDSLGGGICQVSTTLYNAVLRSELEVTERHNHSMIVSYVDPSADAAIAESAGKDFRFVNNTDAPIYIEGFTENKKITFNIYGRETRSSAREVRYESEILEVINPPADFITPDPNQPIGYVVKTGSAYIGYKARLWKVVTENGQEVSRTQINSSSYKMVPRSATVGTATADPNAYNEIMAAIGTGSIDHVQNVIALLAAQAAQPPADTPEE